MTDQPNDRTDEAADRAAAQRARIAQLANQRSTASRGAASRGTTPRGTTPRGAAPGGSTPRPKRRHAAQGARIAAAGMGVTTMLGLVGLMGYSQHASTASASAPAGTAAQPQVVVVIHRHGAPDTLATSVPAGTPIAAPTVSDTGSATVLTARPTVRLASTRSPAPAASTSGSR